MESNDTQAVASEAGHSYFGNEGQQQQQQRKKMHIPFCDADDLAFKNRHDPKFVASITNIMQVPETITLTNNAQNGNRRSNNSAMHGFNYMPSNNYAAFPMDIPDKLTTDDILYDRTTTESPLASNDSMFDDMKDSQATPPSTPTKLSYLESQNIVVADEEKFSKTPQIAADLFKRMRPRRSSIEVDLQAEIRILRDKISCLEHECQVNSRSCKVFYTIIAGYMMLKTISWLVNSK